MSNKKKKIPRNLHVIIIMIIASLMMGSFLVKSFMQDSESQANTPMPEEELAPDTSAITAEIERQKAAAIEADRLLREQQDELERKLRELEERELNSAEQSNDQAAQVDEKALERKEAAAVSNIVALRSENTFGNLGSGLLQQQTTGNTEGSSEAEFKDRYKAMKEALGGASKSDDRSVHEKWLDRISKRETPEPITPSPAHKGIVVHEGTTIPAVLLSRISSDLPGKIIARVVSNVYDTQTGLNLAIPAGSRLIGEYNSQTVKGQNRLMAAFHRIILPNGASLNLTAANGTGNQGTSGLPGKVNTHFFETIGSQLLLATVAWLADTSDNDSSTTINVSGGNSNATGEILGNAADKLMAPYANQKPTIEKEPGETFNVMVNQDILLSNGGA